MGRVNRTLRCFALVLVVGGSTLAAGTPSTMEAAASVCSDVKAAAFDDPGQLSSAQAINRIHWGMQSFQVTSPVVLSKVSLSLSSSRFSLLTDSVTVHIQDGLHNGSVLGQDTRSPFSDDFVFADFFPGPIPLEPNRTYFLVARSSASTSAGFFWGADETTPSYPGGRAHWSTSGGFAWNPRVPESDLLFQIWGTGCTPGSQTDLTVTTSVAEAEPYRAGQTIHYVNTVVNAGAGMAPGSRVLVRDRLPAGAAFRGATVEGVTCTYTPPDVSCQHRALGGGETFTVRLEVVLPSRLPGNRMLTNQVEVDPRNDIAETNQNNNRSQVTIPVLP
jgi:uncharacterized repeat protein (TIGR01451 family)